MLRFLCALFHIPYETCKSCETLKTQLSIANEENKRLTDTLLDLLKPKVYESNPTAVAPFEPKLALIGRRRAAAEERDRLTAKTLKESNNVARPDNPKSNSIEALEEELKVNEQ